MDKVNNVVSAQLHNNPMWQSATMYDIPKYRVAASTWVSSWVEKREDRASESWNIQSVTSHHNSGDKGIQTGFKKKEKKPSNKITANTTFCKHECTQNMAGRKLKIWQTKQKKIIKKES